MNHETAGLGRAGWHIIYKDCFVLDEALVVEMAMHAMRALSPPDGRRIRAEAAPKCTVQQINELVKSIRSNQPPKLPEEIQEERYYDPALTGFYIRLLKTGMASWVVQYKRLGRQRKITLGNVLVLNRPEAVKAGRELLAKMTLGLLD